MDHDLQLILKYLHEERGYDFSGYRYPTVDRRVKQRLAAAKSGSFSEYLRFLKKNRDELDHLLSTLTIKVSRFFRDTLTFEYIANEILPALISEKIQKDDRSLRVWSAGCATGEEAYSMAILIHGIREKEAPLLNLHLFATDIDRTALSKAQEAVYPLKSLEDTKLGLVEKYFTRKGDLFTLIPEIRQSVSFSHYDLLDTRSYVPSESVYGNFDIVLCRNVMIYFCVNQQNILFDKLYRSITENGFLILGKAESPPIKYQKCFRKINSYGHVYQKTG